MVSNGVGDMWSCYGSSVMVGRMVIMVVMMVFIVSVMVW